MSSSAVMAPPREVTKSWDGAFADLRYVVLAVVTAAIVARAGAPPLFWVAAAVALAAPDLLRRHYLAPEAMALGFAFTLWASIAWSRYPSLSEQIARDQATVAALFIAIRVAVTGRRALLILGSGYLLGCLLLLKKVLDENVTASLTFRVDEATRYTIAGVNQNYIAYTMAGGIAVAILLVKVAPRFLLLLVGIGAGCWAGIALTDTRGAIVAGIATTVWWLLVPARFRRGGLKLLIALVLIAALAIVSGWADDRIRAWLPRNSARENGSLNGRLEFWPIARAALSDHLLKGEGAGTIIRRTPGGVFAHDVVLDVGTSAGIIGVAVLFATLYVILFRATSDLTDTPQRLMLIGVVVCAIAPPLLTAYWYQAAPFWILLALFSRMGKAVVSRD